MQSMQNLVEESKLMRVAFLGLGIMGRSMAANLVKAGHEVAVWNRSGGKDVEGARSATSPADAAQGAEVVWMCVADTKAVEAVLFGPGGVDQGLAAGMIIADSSTISPSATRRFAERVKARGVDYVDAPMTGSKIAAEAGLHGAIGRSGLQSSVHSEARFLAEFSSAADAERHSPGARCRQGIARAVTWTGSRGRGLRRRGRGGAAGSGLRLDTYAAGKMGWGGSESGIKVDCGAARSCRGSRGLDDRGRLSLRGRGKARLHT